MRLTRYSFKRPARGGIDDACKFVTVLDAKHQRIDTGDRQRIAMRDDGRVLAELAAERAKGRGAGVILHLGLVLVHLAVDGGSQRAGLHSANAHHADIVVLRGTDDVARLGRLLVAAHTAGQIEKIGYRLHDGGARASRAARP